MDGEREAIGLVPESGVAYTELADSLYRLNRVSMRPADRQQAEARKLDHWRTNSG